MTSTDETRNRFEASDPIVLGAGKSPLGNVEQRSPRLAETPAVKNGLVWLRYQSKGSVKT
jgi:hypothetical protein